MCPNMRFNEIIVIAWSFWLVSLGIVHVGCIKYDSVVEQKATQKRIVINQKKRILPDLTGI